MCPSGSHDQDTPSPPVTPRGARHAPHTLRNRAPILAILRKVLAGSRRVLEIGCGTGEQAPYFCAALDHLTWLCSDGDPEAVASAALWREAAANPRLLPPLVLDAARPDWPLPEGFHPDAILSINMLHIAPPEAGEGLLAGAGRLLPPHGPLILYGPFHRKDEPTAPSNIAFDTALRARNPSWGLRHLEAVTLAARDHGLIHDQTHEMPANNLMIVFRKAAAAAPSRSPAA